MINENTQGYFVGSTLKWLAIIAMFINHIGDIVLEGVIMNAPYSAFSDFQFLILSNCYSIFHAIGRISMPIFCFFIVEGFIHTSDVKKYLIRLALFSIISEIPYDLAFGTSAFDFAQQNVFFTLMIGLYTLIMLNKYKNNKWVIVIVPIFMVLLAYFLKFDGSYYGILMIVLFYIFKDKRMIKCISIFVLQMIIMISFRESFDLSQVFAIVPLVSIYFYNGKRGGRLKYFFYLFYPLHLLILALITKLVIVPFYV